MGSEVRLETQVERGLGFLDAHHIHRLFIVHIFAFQLVLSLRNAISSPSEDPKSQNFPGLRPWPPLGGLTAPPNPPAACELATPPTGAPLVCSLCSSARYARFSLDFLKSEKSIITSMICHICMECCMLCLFSSLLAVFLHLM